MILRDKRSIVGIDPTPRGIAFVFFEGGELLDWGQMEGEADDASQVALVDRLIDGCAADVVVLEDGVAPGSKRKPRMQYVLRLIAAHARKRRMLVAKVARSDVREAWADRGITTKEATAAAIAEILPVLGEIVPPRRKIGANEAERVNIFDAASLVLHYDETSRSDTLP
jgi:hypothetical protein